MTFEQARAQFPVLERYAYLNAGTFGPLARPTAAAVEAQLGRDLEHGRAGKAYFDRVLALRDEVRAHLALLLGVNAATVSLTSSTTEGCNVVLAGLDLHHEHEIVTTEEEHFGLLGPLHASGARVVVARADADSILAAVTPRTRLIAISHVLWTTGRTLPIGEIRRASGVPALVDGAQAAGAIPVDASEVDFYTVSGQKWLCGPDSTGALVVADPERLRVAWPSYFSQASHDHGGLFVPRDGAARFDPGWLSAASLAGLQAALELPPEWCYERALAMAASCRSRLAARFRVEPGDATLVSFTPVEDPAELVPRLHEAGVIVRDIPGTGLIRVSCGWWTSDGDLDRLLAALA